MLARTGKHDAGEQITRPASRDDVQIVLATQRHTRAFGSEQRHRVTHDEAHHLAHAKRLAHRARHVGKRFRLPYARADSPRTAERCSVHSPPARPS